VIHWAEYLLQNDPSSQTGYHPVHTKVVTSWGVRSSASRLLQERFNYKIELTAPGEYRIIERKRPDYLEKIFAAGKKELEEISSTAASEASKRSMKNEK
jgi:hypothetical protein